MRAEKIFGKQMRERVWSKSGGKCWYCGCLFELADNWAIDHFIPGSKGGSHDLTNLVPSCHRCNCLKGNSDLNRFRELLALRLAGWPKFLPTQIIFLRSKNVAIPSADDCLFYFESVGE